MMLQADDEQQELRRLKALMRSPSYWRDHDKKIHQEVQKGFERLYDKPNHQHDGNKHHDDLPEAKKGQMANILGINGQENADDSIIGHLTPGKLWCPSMPKPRN